MDNLTTRTEKAPTIKRLNYLLQQGFSKKEICDLTNIQKGTLTKVLSYRTKKITFENHNKIKALYSDYIISQAQSKEDDEFVNIVEIEADELKNWAIFIFATVTVLTIILIFVIKYISSLF
jgi:hypothetical protein